MNMSLTQTGNYTALAAVLFLIGNRYGIHISEMDITNIIISFITIGGIITSFIGRYRHGDVSLLGVKQQVDDSRGNL